MSNKLIEKPTSQTEVLFNTTPSAIFKKDCASFLEENDNEENSLLVVPAHKMKQILDVWLIENGFIREEKSQTTNYIHAEKCLHVKLSIKENTYDKTRSSLIFEAFGIVTVDGQQNKLLFDLVFKKEKEPDPRYAHVATLEESSVFLVGNEKIVEVKPVYFSSQESRLLSSFAHPLDLVHRLRNSLELLDVISPPVAHDFMSKTCPGYSINKEKIQAITSKFNDIEWLDTENLNFLKFYGRDLDLWKAFHQHLPPSFVMESLDIDSLLSALRAWKESIWVLYTIEGKELIDKGNIEDWPLPPQEHWLPIQEANGFPHVLLDHLQPNRSPLIFLAALKAASPEQLLAWLGNPSKQQSCLALDFLEKFPQLENIQHFLKVVEEKIPLNKVCWNHEGKTLLSVFVDVWANGAYKEKEERPAHYDNAKELSKYWDVFQFIDPSFQSTLMKEENFLLLSQKEYRLVWGVDAKRAGDPNQSSSHHRNRLQTFHKTKQTKGRYPNYLMVQPLGGKQDLLDLFNEMAVTKWDDQAEKRKAIAQTLSSIVLKDLLLHKVHKTRKIPDLSIRPPLNRF